MSNRVLRTALFAVILNVALAAPLVAQTSFVPSASELDDPAVFEPNVAPVLDLQKTQGRIVIDGVLDDEGWQDASIARNFSETFPDDQTKPPIGIEAWMTYDEHNVYFAFVIEDDPSAVRVNMSDRDAIWQDDYVGIVLDTYGDNAWAYFLAVNPIGIQGDTRIMATGREDIGFDVVFKSDGQLTETGFQVEIAVPFRSLRFPNAEVQDWRLNYWITHPRESRNTYSWVAKDRDDSCWLCQAGTATGITGAKPGGKIELLPALTGTQAGALDDFSSPEIGLSNDRFTADPSFGLKYSFSSNLIADVAVNPDFSQIESDAAQVDVNTTFALFFPERRPFFQEGSDMYNTRINQVYTRSLNNPKGVAKFSGRSGRTSFGYIGGLDEDSPIILPFEESSAFAQAGESFSNILRVKQTFGRSSYLGGLVTDRRYLDNAGSGSTVSVDGSVRLSSKYSISGQFVASQTAEQTDEALSAQVGNFEFADGHTAAFDGENYAGYAASLAFNRQARHFWFETEYSATSPTFRAANGFVTQNNVHQTFGMVGYTFYLDKGPIQRIMPDVMGGYWWNFDGQRKDEFLWLGTRLQMKRQTFVGVRALIFSNERFAGNDYRGLSRLNVNLNSNFSQKVQVGGYLSYGKSISRGTQEMGQSFDYSISGTFRPTSRVSVSPRFTYASLDSDETGEEIFSGYIARATSNYQFSKRLFLRVVTQYNDFSSRLEIDPLLTYKVNPFTAVYIGSTHDFQDFDLQRETGNITGYYSTQRQIFFKLQYLFRV